jgi:hypothetical protein
MTNIDHAMTATIINQLPPRFDAHLLERRLLRLHTVAVAREMIAFNHTGDPLHQFSAALARWVDREFHRQIRQTQKVTSENLGGEQSQNQEWGKIVGQIA